MSTREWTDLDYAQAAIDMLPGSVEEIAEFLRVNKVEGRSHSGWNCPVANWVHRWTGEADSFVGRETLEVRGRYGKFQYLSLPQPVRQFIHHYDYGDISL